RVRGGHDGRGYRRGRVRHLDQRLGSGRELLRWGHRSLRVASWQGRPDVALVVPLPGSGPPDRAAVEAWLSQLRARCYRRGITSALVSPERQAFFAAGFTVREHIHLLSRPVGQLDPPRAAPSLPVRMRRGRRTDWPALLAVDAESFSEEWRFDATALA